MKEKYRVTSSKQNMKKNVRASSARKDHHLAQVRSQFTREYIKINVQICLCLLCVVVRPEIKEKYCYQKGSFSK